jgi:catechol 2,3-dioxygenase-like lactoylglutathione lyase family enzyme
MATGRFVVALMIAWVAGLLAQGTSEVVPPWSPSALAQGACHVSPIVRDLDRAAAFYRDVLGLTLYPGREQPGPLPWDADPGHLDIHGTRGGRMRFVGARMPGVWCGVEIVEFDRLERAPIQRQLQDPGAVMLIVLVRDVDAVFTRAKRAGIQVVTTGGAPIPVGNGKTRAVVVRDPDGHFVEIAQLDPLPSTPLPLSSDVIGLRLRVTVADLEKTLHVYHDLLGFEIRAGEFRRDASVAAMLGLGEAEYRVTTARAPLRLNSADTPASNMLLEFIEFKGVARPLARSHIQDPGSYRLFVNVRDIDAATAALRGAGSAVVSTGGQPASMTFGRGRWRIAGMPDPNNLFLILLQNP